MNIHSSFQQMYWLGVCIEYMLIFLWALHWRGIFIAFLGLSSIFSWMSSMHLRAVLADATEILGNLVELWCETVEF